MHIATKLAQHPAGSLSSCGEDGEALRVIIPDDVELSCEDGGLLNEYANILHQVNCANACPNYRQSKILFRNTHDDSWAWPLGKRRCAAVNAGARQIEGRD